MIEKDWTFDDAVNNIETLKTYYGRLLTSFSVFERKKRILLCRKFKTQIYSLKFEEYLRNKIWKYINDEIEYEELTGGVSNNGFSNKTNDRKI